MKYLLEKIKKLISILINNLYLKNIIILSSLFLFIIFIIFNTKIDIDNNLNNKKIIKVDVKGEINNEGIYELQLGQTYNDLFKLLDFKEDADISSFNLNTALSNKQVIIIPKLKEYNLISINNATIEELCTLSGIGPSLANSIIIYRNDNGGFKNLEDLMNIRGIGEKKFNKIKEYITL